MNNPTLYTDPSGYKFEGNRMSDCIRNDNSWGGSSFSQRFVFNSSFQNNGYSYVDMGQYSHYVNSKGERVDYSEVQNNYITPYSRPVSRDQIITALNNIQSVYKFYSVQFRSGYTSYATSYGDIGNATVSSNGGLGFSNPTATLTPLSFWAEEAGKSNLFGDINTGLGAFGTLNSIGINIAHDYISYGFKSANGWQEFNKLASNQQAWRAARVLGKTGANILKYAKNLGYLGAAAGVGVATYQLIEKPTLGNATRLAVQGAAIGVAFIPVVGWGVSLGIGAADLIWGDQFYNWIDKQ